MKYKHSLFFNHFIQPSPLTIVKLKSSHGFLRVNFPHNNGPIHLWLAPLLIASKSPNLNVLPSPVNMTTMRRQNTKFPPTARSPRQA